MPPCHVQQLCFHTEKKRKSKELLIGAMSLKFLHTKYCIYLICNFIFECLEIIVYILAEPLIAYDPVLNVFLRKLNAKVIIALPK